MNVAKYALRAVPGIFLPPSHPRGRRRTLSSKAPSPIPREPCSKGKRDITNSATGESSTSFSNGVGLDDFSNLNHRHLQPESRSQGLQSFATSNGIVMNVAATVQENVTLKIGAGLQTVTVRGGFIAPADRDQRSQQPDHRPADHTAGDQRPEHGFADNSRNGRFEQCSSRLTE